MRELGLENELLRKGRAEGLTEGRAEGILEGRAEGEKERKKLEKENATLKAELEELRKKITV